MYCKRKLIKLNREYESCTKTASQLYLFFQNVNRSLFYYGKKFSPNLSPTSRRTFISLFATICDLLKMSKCSYELGPIIQ